MLLLAVTVDPFFMTYKHYKNFTAHYDDDDYLKKTGQQNYPLFVFNCFTTILFQNLLVTSYLTVMLFFVSVSINQIKSLQVYIINMIDTNTLVTDNYTDAKNRIISLKNGSYLSTQILFITATINLVCFMFLVRLNRYNYTHSTDDNPFTYKEMIFNDFSNLPYLLKGYT